MTDELLLGRESRASELEISDVRLLDKVQRLQRLNKRNREAVIILIDGVLARRAIESASSHLCFGLPHRLATQRPRVCRCSDGTLAQSGEAAQLDEPLQGQVCQQPVHKERCMLRNSLLGQPAELSC